MIKLFCFWLQWLLWGRHVSACCKLLQPSEILWTLHSVILQTNKAAGRIVKSDSMQTSSAALSSVAAHIQNTESGVITFPSLFAFCGSSQKITYKASWWTGLIFVVVKDYLWSMSNQISPKKTLIQIYAELMITAISNPICSGFQWSYIIYGEEKQLKCQK